MLRYRIGMSKCAAGWTILLLLVASAATSPPTESRKESFDITKRVPLTTSKVVGSPDPPPPYRVKRLYPNLKINYPIAVRHQPGSDRLWFITQGYPYGPTNIHRMKDDPDAKEFETLLKLDGTAYDICFHPRFAE